MLYTCTHIKTLKYLDPRAVSCIFLVTVNQEKDTRCKKFESAILPTCRDLKNLEDQFVSANAEVRKQAKKIRFSDQIVVHEMP